MTPTPRSMPSPVYELQPPSVDPTGMPYSGASARFTSPRKRASSSADLRASAAHCIKSVICTPTRTSNSYGARRISRPLRCIFQTTHRGYRGAKRGIQKDVLLWWFILSKTCATNPSATFAKAHSAMGYILRGQSGHRLSFIYHTFLVGPHTCDGEGGTTDYTTVCSFLGRG